MTLTLDFLINKRACSEGVEWFKAQGESDPAKLCKLALKDGKFQWANWTMVRVMDRKQRLQYAIFAAEQVLDIFEKKYPKDQRPRKAIEAARKVLEEDTPTNRKAAYAAAAAAYAAYAAAYAAADADAAAAAAYAAYAAAYDAAAAAAYAAYAAAYDAADAAAAYAAAYDAADADAADADAADADAAAAAAARKKLQIKILNYGMKLLNLEEKQ